MSDELLASFCIIVAIGAMLPGPNGLLIVTNSIVHGWKTALVTLMGTLTAFYAHGLFSVLGISALLMSSTKVFLAVKSLCAMYLAFLGCTFLIQSFKRAPFKIELNLAKKTQSKNYRKAWTQGFITNLLNPKVSLFYLALFPHFITDAANIAATTTFLVTVQVLIVGIWFTCVALVSAKAKGLGRPLFMRLIKCIAGSLFLWFAFNLTYARTRT